MTIKEKHSQYMKKYYHRKKTLKKSDCVVCGEDFEHYAKAASFCSKQCSFSKKVIVDCQECGMVYEVKPSRVNKTKFCSKVCMGRWHRDERSPNWQGGKSKERELLQGRHEYKDWRKSVFERDNYTCVDCGDSTGGNLNADHIKPWSLFPKERYNIDNGRTLCAPCHKQTKSWGSKVRTMTIADFSDAIPRRF